jgi:ribonuclease Y
MFREIGTIIIILIADVVIAAGVIYLVTRLLINRFKDEQKNRADNVLQVARETARELEMKAKDEAIQIKQNAESELSKRRAELDREDERLMKRRTDLDHRVERLEQREQALNKRQSSIDKRANEIDRQHSKVLEELQRVAQMTTEEAKQELLTTVEVETRQDMARIIRQIELEAKLEGEKKAREVIADSIQRIASDHVIDITTSVVALPNEEMKGRIVGRNGRNIRAFEQAAGVDVIVDDTPEAVTVSCFDSVRREIARRALDRLILDGRIHPAHIEKILEEERREVDRAIKEAGEEAAFDAGVVGLHPEILKKIGRLKYRTSYGQNQLAHAVESARISASIASEIGANVDIARMGGFLHDLGKAMDHNAEGTHASLGAEFARRHGVNKTVVNIIASHHHEIDQECVEAVIVEAADAISGARPGARREDLEQYIKRLKVLEEIANGHKGVSESYAIQAGREVRIIVKPDDVDDLAAIQLSKDIARKIEETMQYPGQIKVTVIRETRAVDFAK